MLGPGEKRRENIDPNATLSTRASISSSVGNPSTLRYTKTVSTSPPKRPSSGWRVEAVLRAHGDVPDRGEEISSLSRRSPSSRTPRRPGPTPPEPLPLIRTTASTGLYPWWGGVGKHVHPSPRAATSFSGVSLETSSTYAPDRFRRDRFHKSSVAALCRTCAVAGARSPPVHS